MTTPPGNTLYDSIIKSLNESLKQRASIDMNDPTTIPIFMKNFKKTMTMFLVIFVSSMMLYYNSTNKNAMESKLYYYLFMVMVVIAIGYFIGKEFFLPSSEASYEAFLKGSLYLLVGFILIQILMYLSSSATGLVALNLIAYILIFGIIIVGLALTYILFSNYLKQQPGYFGIFIRTLFYLPCLFADFVNYLKTEWNMTPHIVVILLILEIILIGIYFVLPKLMNKMSKMNSNVLLYDPVELNNERTIAGSNYFLVNKLEELDESGKESLENKLKKWFNRVLNKDTLPESKLYKENPTYRDTNYSISFWTYVNTGSTSDQAYIGESNILNYANGKPRITYTSNGQHKGTKYNIYYTNAPSVPPFEIELSHGNQKWNNFVITYHDNSVNIFINGKLIRTAVFNKNNLPLPGNESDTIVVGQDNGLRGAICNVSYYPYALSTREISTSYNILRFKNPPKLI